MEYLVSEALLTEQTENGTETDTVDDSVNSVALTEMTELRDALIRAVERAARAEGELAAELRRGADLAATVADLRATLEQERQERIRLASELTERRRPWIVQVLASLRR
jgi:hypothetical protein